MKVKDLIKELKQCDQEAEVIMSMDAEGNAFSLYSDLVDGYYEGDGRFLEVAYGAESKEEYEEDYGLNMDVVKKCVVLFRV